MALNFALQTGKQPKRTQRYFKIDSVFYRCIAAIGVFALVVGGLYGYEFFEKNQLAAQVNNLKIANSTRNPADEITIRSAMKTYNTLSAYLDGHTNLTPIFDFFEKNALNIVTLSGFRFAYESDQPTVSVHAVATGTTNAQVASVQRWQFASDPRQSQILISNLGISADGLAFDIKVVFNSGILAYGYGQ